MSLQQKWEIYLILGKRLDFVICYLGEAGELASWGSEPPHPVFWGFAFGESHLPAGFPLKTEFPLKAGFIHILLVSQPFLGQTGSNFRGIKYIYGMVFSLVK